jgi:gamma-glutamyl-gamma-aminobutyrate hydrolase PuuD
MKVLIVSGSQAYSQMWLKLGATLVDDIRKADLVQFTGGEDVSPRLYGEQPHPTTASNFGRDLYEAGYYAIAKRMGIPMAGICRGGQFLNVMNGGDMYQNVDGHTIYGTHECKDVLTGKVHQVTSTHHQMMWASEREGAEIVATAKEATHLDFVEDGKGVSIPAHHEFRDLEAVFYHDTQSLCFQPHPEFGRANSTLSYYVELLNRYFGFELKVPG